MRGVIKLRNVSVPRNCNSDSMPLFILLSTVCRGVPFVGKHGVSTRRVRGHCNVINSPIVVNMILNLVFNLTTNRNFGNYTDLVVAITTVVILFPHVVHLVIRNLLPVSSNTEGFFRGCFGKHRICVNLSATIALKRPAAVTINLLLVPVVLVLTDVLPNGGILPLTSLPMTPFFVYVTAIVRHKSLIEALVDKIVIVVAILLVTARFTPCFARVTLGNNFDFTNRDTRVSTLSINGVFN